VFRRPLMAFVALVILLALGACGGGEQNSSTTPAVPAAPPAQAFPVTVEGSDGPVTIQERPERIVSLSPTATESLFAMGAGDQVVAVDDQSNYPAQAPVTKLSGYTPNLEAIAGYEPDLVIAAFDPGELVRGLQRLEIPVLLQDAAKNLDEAYAQIDALGVATGNEARARAVIAGMRGRIAKAVSSVPSTAPRSVYHELGPDYFSATSETFIGSIYEELGLENIADGVSGQAPDYPQLSAEYIVSENPELIVLSDTKCCGQTPEKVAARPGWSKIAAVRSGNVLPVDDDIASRWGPRTVEFVELVVDAVAEAQAA
jgi:iron complex transport system substrate-binding protein